MGNVVLFLTSLFFAGVGAFCVELQHLQIQGCHFLKSALNLVLIADSESTQKSVQTRTGIIDLGAFCVELWPSQVSYRISVPMSYISWLSIDVYPNVSRYTRTCPGTPRRERDRPCLILLTITNGTSPCAFHSKEPPKPSVERFLLTF